MSEVTTRPGSYMDGYNQAKLDCMIDQGPDVREGSEEHRIMIAIEDIRSTLTGRNPHYKVPPAEYVDIEILIAQMVLKAERARQAVDIERQIDEVRDTAGYAILILGRLLNTTTQPEVSDHDHTQHFVNSSYVIGYNQALSDNNLPVKHDVDLILHGRKLQSHLDKKHLISATDINVYREDKTDEEFSMFSDGYHQAMKDIRDDEQPPMTYGEAISDSGS
jgi:hypothetical protein